jgi:hypothetical protein
MKIEKRQTVITLDTEELSTIENAMAILSDLINTLEEEHETALFGRCGHEISYEELWDAVDILDILDTIRWTKGDFTID